MGGHQCFYPKVYNSSGGAYKVMAEIKARNRVHGMAQSAKAFAAKPDNLSLSPRTHVVEGES